MLRISDSMETFIERSSVCVEKGRMSRKDKVALGSQRESLSVNPLLVQVYIDSCRCNSHYKRTHTLALSVGARKAQETMFYSASVRLHLRHEERVSRWRRFRRCAAIQRVYSLSALHPLLSMLHSSIELERPPSDSRSCQEGSRERLHCSE